MEFSRQEYWSGVPSPPPGLSSCLIKATRPRMMPLASLSLDANNRSQQNPALPVEPFIAEPTSADGVLWGRLSTALSCCLLVAGTADTGLFTVLSPCWAPIRSDAAAESCFLFPSSLGATAFFSSLLLPDHQGSWALRCLRRGSKKP